MTNIIYAAKIVSETEDAEFYQQELKRLDASYPAKWRNGIAPNLLSVSASVGLDGIIEFNDLEVVDL
jgi:hypothetical protein